MKRFAKLSNGRFLTIKIDGERTVYAVSKIETHHEVACPAFAVQKLKIVFEGQKFPTFENDGEPYHCALEPHGYTCTCGDFEGRRRGVGGACKHLKALIAVKLMPKIKYNEECR